MPYSSLTTYNTYSTYSNYSNYFSTNTSIPSNFYYIPRGVSYRNYSHSNIYYSNPQQKRKEISQVIHTTTNKRPLFYPSTISNANNIQAAPS